MTPCSVESIVKNARAAARQLGNNLAVETMPGKRITVFYVYNPLACTGERTRVGTVGDADAVAVATALLAETARLRNGEPAIDLMEKEPVEDFGRQRARLAAEVERLREKMRDIRTQERLRERPLPVIEARIQSRHGRVA